jgi:ATP-dependent protease HslVU (ClpYQ) peptidase subunit
MTVVAAIARDGEIAMAADTATNYCGTRVDGAVKVRRIDVAGEAALIAAAGNGALLPVILRNLKVDAQPDPGDAQQWTDEIAGAITDICAAQTPPLLEDGERIDGALLLGWRGQLWYLFTHQATLVADGVAALGAGCDTALGAMHASLDRGADVEESTRTAVRLACRFAEGCAVGESGPLVERLASS